MILAVSALFDRRGSDLLGGLGNSASAAAGVAIEAAPHDSRVPVRAVAVRTLRLTRGPEVDGFVMLVDAIR